MFRGAHVRALTTRSHRSAHMYSARARVRGHAAVTLHNRRGGLFGDTNCRTKRDDQTLCTTYTFAGESRLVYGTSVILFFKIKGRKNETVNDNQQLEIFIPHFYSFAEIISPFYKESF